MKKRKRTMTMINVNRISEIVYALQTPLVNMWPFDVSRSFGRQHPIFYFTKIARGLQQLCLKNTIENTNLREEWIEQETDELDRF